MPDSRQAFSSPFSSPLRRGSGGAPSSFLRRGPPLSAEKLLKGDAWRHGGSLSRVPPVRAAAPRAAATAAGTATSRGPAGRHRLLPRGALEPGVAAAGAARAHRAAGAQRGPRAAGHAGCTGAAAPPAGAHGAVVSAAPPTVSRLLPRSWAHAASSLLSWHRAGRARPTRARFLFPSCGPDPCVSSSCYSPPHKNGLDPRFACWPPIRADPGLYPGRAALPNPLNPFGIHTGSREREPGAPTRALL